MNAYYVYWSFSMYAKEDDWCRCIVYAYNESDAKVKGTQKINNHLAWIRKVVLK